MSDQPLVSIIIPTYNRAHLIGETLDSVLAQTYQNWECIVVDDGSTDDTDKVMAQYCEKDSRFQYHHRPQDRLPGGNAARNYGFEMSKGEYVNWFDSDDLMFVNKIELQVEGLYKTGYDYCIDRYIDFYDNFITNYEDPFLKNEILELNLDNYLLNKVYWGTINFMGKRSILLNTTYNENLKSGQEYNFFIALLSSDNSLKAKYINKVLAYRRVHINSIQQNQTNDKNLRLVNKFNVYWKTYLSFNHNLTAKQSLFLLQKATSFYQKIVLEKNIIIPISLIFSEISRKMGLMAMLKIYGVIYFNYIFNKGEVMGSKIINKTFNRFFN